MAQDVKNPPAIQEMEEIRVQFLHREDPLEEEMQSTLVFLPENFHGAEEPRGLQSMGSQKVRCN